MLHLLLACTGPVTDEPVAEPLVLPDDASEDGAPVGVTTVVTDDVTMEVWYPASDTTSGATEIADFDAFLPDVFLTAVGDVSFRALDTGAYRDAPLRVPESPYPVIFFSHGLGGVRLQSYDYTRHLASRGYVVVAADHPGRMMGDLLPCMFSPPLDGCELGGMTGEDPAEDDVGAMLEWLDGAAEDGFFAGAIDTAHVGLSGHSAGAGTTITVGDDNARFSALLPMAGSGAPDRNVPTLLMGGTCDSFSLDTEAIPAAESLLDGNLVRVLGAGHLAFSNLCELDLAGNADLWLADREDLNSTVFGLLLQLATDGCPGFTPSADACGETSYLPLETSAPIVRHYSTVFFDATLKQSGPGVEAGAYTEADVR
jgi:predicted dienelactone hydrolase